MQLLRKQLFKPVFCRQAFCSGKVEAAQVAQTKSENLAIHLRPYDSKRYEVPSSKLKLTTGYAFLDVEPVPRAKIMKICYIVLEKLKTIPEQALYRLYTEEKMKYIMKLTDQMDDIRRLEEELGFESIELFIQTLHREIRLVDEMRDGKPWEMRDGDSSWEVLKQKRPDAKHQVQSRPPREQAKFLN